MESDIIHSDGKQYVSRKEFAKRVGIGERTMKTLTTTGKIPTTTFKKCGVKYIEWETGYAIWKQLPKNRQRQAAGKASALKRKAGKVKEPAVVEPSVPELSAEMPEQIALEDLSTFDLSKYSDCVIDGEMDYDKLKMRLTAETYQLKLDKERGLLLDKTDVVTWARNIGSILSNSLEAIPQRYTAILTAKCQMIVAEKLGRPDFEFSAEDKADIRKSLNRVGPDIMNSIKLVIMEMEE